MIIGILKKVKQVAEAWLVDVNNNGGKINMDKKQIVLWSLIGILGILVLYVVFFQGSAGTAQSTLSASQAAAQQAASGYSASAMVGGC